MLKEKEINNNNFFRVLAQKKISSCGISQKIMIEAGQFERKLAITFYLHRAYFFYLQHTMKAKNWKFLLMQ